MFQVSCASMNASGPKAQRRAGASFSLCPHSGRLHVPEELEVDYVRVAADGAVFDVLLLAAGGGIKRDHDRLAAGRADVGALIPRPRPSLLPFPHAHGCEIEPRAASYASRPRIQLKLTGGKDFTFSWIASAADAMRSDCAQRVS